MKKHMKLLLIALALTLFIPTLSINAKTSETSNTAFKRLGGKDRFDTAAMISEAAYPNGSQNVIIVGHNGEIDALTGTMLAAYKNAPILFTNSKKLSKATEKELMRLKAKNIYILGGDKAVSNKVEMALDKMFNVERITGKDRYETSANIAKFVGKDIQFSQAFVVLGSEVNGLLLSDSFDIATVSARDVIPILLVKNNSLPQQTADTLKELNIKNLTFVGRGKSVTDNVFNALNENGHTVNKIVGNSAYETAMLITKKYFSNAEKLLITNSLDYVDIVIGGYFGGLINAPILFADALENSKFSDDYNKIIKQINNLTVLGGTKFISEQQYLLQKNNFENLSNQALIVYPTVKIIVPQEGFIVGIANEVELIFTGNSFEGVQILDQVLFNDLLLGKIAECDEIDKLEVYLDGDEYDEPFWYELSELNDTDESDDPDYLESDRVKLRFTFSETAKGGSYNFSYKIIQKSTGNTLAQTTAILKVATAYQLAPSGLSGVTPTSAANNDGKIANTTVDMEYKLISAVDWITASASETIVLPETYLVRKAAKPGYPASPSVTITVNSYGLIQGITIPVRKGLPVATITETPQYTGIVTWNPNDAQFRSSTVYTATITLTAKVGFDFNSITENLFTVLGATTTTNLAKSNIVTAVFPKTIIASSVTLGEIKRVAGDEKSRLRLLEDINEDGHPSEFISGAEEAVGQTIGIQVIPNENGSYRLKDGTLKAVYTDGVVKEITLTPVGTDGGLYIFKMPAFLVTITAEFESKP